MESYYNLQGEIEIANTQAHLSAIMQIEFETISAYVRRLEELHSILDNLGDPVSVTKRATNLINSLNTHYRPMVKTIQTWSLSPPHLLGPAAVILDIDRCHAI